MGTFQKRVKAKAHEMLSLWYFKQDMDAFCGCQVYGVSSTAPSLYFSKNDFERIDAAADTELGEMGLEFKWREYYMSRYIWNGGNYVDAAKLDNLHEKYGPNGLFLAFWPKNRTAYVWRTTDENMKRWASTVTEVELPKDNASDEKEMETVYSLPFKDARSVAFDASGWDGRMARYAALVASANR